jgi:hypothetical protein
METSLLQEERRDLSPQMDLGEVPVLGDEPIDGDSEELAPSSNVGHRLPKLAPVREQR